MSIDPEEPAATPEGVPIPVFTPFVPIRRRGNGWTAATQRAFVAELTRIGSARAAAQAVGRSVRSAYVLRDKPGAESFAAAWATALERARETVRDTAINRALHGEIVPQFRNGKFTGYKKIDNDRLLIGVLGSVPDTPWSSNGERYRLEQWEAALRREEMDRAEGRAEQAKSWDDHVIWQRELDRVERTRRKAEIRVKVNAPARRPRHQPGIRPL